MKNYKQDLRKIPVSRQSWFGLELMQVPGKELAVIVRKVRGMLLIERSDFIKYVETEGIIKQLQQKNLLTSYHSNGTPKRRKKGKLPNTKTYYNLKEWLNIDFNDM